MNITNGLLHRSQTGVRHAASTTGMDGDPPRPGLSGPSGPGPSGPRARAPWPTGAKVIVAILLVATVFATVGAAVGLASGDDGSNERQLTDQVATLTAERDEALADIEALDAELAALREQLAQAEAGNDDLAEQTAALEERIAELNEQRDTAAGTVDELRAELTTAQQALVTAIAERDGLAALFPMKFDASLGTTATTGTYDVTLSQLYCSGFTTCGKAPSLADLTITSTADGQLRFTIPQFAEGGLFRADGVFHTVLDTTTAVPACDGVARTARVAMTIVPGSYEIGDDGVRDVTGLSAVITVEAPAVGACPAGLAFYSADLAPHA